MLFLVYRDAHATLWDAVLAGEFMWICDRYVLYRNVKLLRLWHQILRGKFIIGEVVEKLGKIEKEILQKKGEEYEDKDGLHEYVNLAT